MEGWKIGVEEWKEWVGGMEDWKEWVGGMEDWKIGAPPFHPILPSFHPSTPAFYLSTTYFNTTPRSPTIHPFSGLVI